MRWRAARPGSGRIPAALAAGLLALLAALGALCAAPPRAAAVFHADDDWRHVQAVLETLERHPGSTPVVYLLGGSSARESLTDEPGWRAQIAAYGGGSMRAYNFGSASQTYAQGIAVVQRSPAVPTIVLIGVNVGRYTPPYPEDSAGAGAPSEAAAAPGGRTYYDSHRFHVGAQLSDSAKRALVSKWLRERFPVFKARYDHHAAMLGELVVACQARGFYPVIVELPLNLPIVGHAWDAPRHKYQAACRVVAKTYGCGYVDFIPDIGLTSSDFVDLAHLVEPGRAKYQRRLSHLVVNRLRQYHIDSITPRKERVPDNG
jgi:hypothetical protein